MGDLINVNKLIFIRIIHSGLKFQDFHEIFVLAEGNLTLLLKVLCKIYGDKIDF